MDKRHAFRLFLALIFVIGGTSCGLSQPSVKIDEIYIWSHNDYEQKYPLETALNFGYSMIEADIHLIDGKLYVAHDKPEDLKNVPVLEEIYLKPLIRRIDENGGKVFPVTEQPFYLVIDVKSEAAGTFVAIKETIEPYRNYFTRRVKGEWKKGAINLLISGNRPELDSDKSGRIAFLDGRIPDLGQGYSSDYFPVISDNWFKYFTWDGSGEIPEEEFKKLRQFVNQAHSENKLIRFWGIPETENMWRTLLETGVDIINVDDLKRMHKFMEKEFITDY